MIKILDIKPVEGKNSRKLVKFSNGKELEVSEESIYKYGLYAGAEFDQNEYDNTIFNITTDEAYSKALIFVCRKLRTKKELAQKLSQSGYDANCIEGVIAKLEERGYINDEIYAERFIRTNIKLSNKSSRFIFHELMLKGVDEETAIKALSKFEINDSQRALTLLQKKFSSIQNKDVQYKDIVKMKRFLYNKGFDSEIIKCAIEKMLGKDYYEEVGF